MTAHKEYLVSDLFSIRYGNGKLTNKHMKANPGPYPVFGASADPRKSIGTVEMADFKQDGLSFIRIGYAGHVAFRRAPFSVTCNVLVLVPKPEMEQRLHLPYFIPVMSAALRRMAVGRFKEDGSQDYTQISQQTAMSAAIAVPVAQDELPDLDEQIALAARHSRIVEVKASLKQMAARLHAITLRPSYKNVRTSEFALSDCFNLFRGKGEYTRAYARDHRGSFPLYTAATQDVNPDEIDTWDHDTEALHCTSEGAHAGTVFHRPRHKFSMTGHACMMVKRMESIDYRFAYYALSALCRELGFRWASNTASRSKLAKLRLTFPVLETEEPDLLTQQSIATHLDQAVLAKTELHASIGRLTRAEVVIESS